MSGLSADDTKCAETGEWLVELRGIRTAMLLAVPSGDGSEWAQVI
jgi:hypothetical protein